MRFRASDPDAGARLDAAVAQHGLAPSRAAAARLIDAGSVTVDGRARPRSHRLAPGELVEAAPPPAEPVAAPADFEVVFEDDHLLVVDKPAGVVVHPGAGRRAGTLVQALADRAAGGDDPDRPGIVHRLDRDTSGLLVVAKSDSVHAALQRMIRARDVERAYLALVAGRPDARTGTIDAPLGRDRRRRTVMSTSSDRPRAARTYFEVIEELPSTTLLEATLDTGRTHQIRAHLAAIGHPVCGDPRYGGRECGRRIALTRQFLHARRLTFRHPVTGELLRCESKPPAELRRSLDLARRDPVSGGPDGG